MGKDCEPVVVESFPNLLLKEAMPGRGGGGGEGVLDEGAGEVPMPKPGTETPDAPNLPRAAAVFSPPLARTSSSLTGFGCGNVSWRGGTRGGTGGGFFAETSRRPGGAGTCRWDWLPLLSLTSAETGEPDSARCFGGGGKEAGSLSSVRGLTGGRSTVPPSLPNRLFCDGACQRSWSWSVHDRNTELYTTGARTLFLSPRPVMDEPAGDDADADDPEALPPPPNDGFFMFLALSMPDEAALLRRSILCWGVLRQRGGAGRGGRARQRGRKLGRAATS